MSSQKWTKLSYTKNSELPLLGEIIILRYPIGTIYFPYGPVSALATTANSASSATPVYSDFKSSSTGNPTGVKAVFHYVLVCSVNHDPQNHLVDLSFMPIMSYCSPPPNAVRSSWDADRWMSQQATYPQRLHHLPVPAANWTPSPSPSFAPVLSFGNWVNSRPAWLAMVVVPYQIPEMHEWCRHPGGPVMLDGGDSGIANLFRYLLTNIPQRLNGAQHASTTIANIVRLPDYHDVWTDIYDSCSVNGCSVNGANKGFVLEFEPITDADIDRALAGDDGIDPITFWNFPGAPKELRAIAEQQEKIIRDGKILEWNDRFVGDDSDPSEGGGSGYLESEPMSEAVLDVQEVAFGEEASGVQD